MSKENIELARSWQDAWNRDGFEGIRPMIHPEAVIRAIDEWPDDPLYHGIEGFERLAAEWTQQFDRIQLEAVRLVSVSEYGVLALFNMNGEIKGTGVPISVRMGVLFEDFREGKQIAKMRFILGWDKALEAAGLSE